MDDPPNNCADYLTYMSITVYLRLVLFFSSTTRYSYENLCKRKNNNINL